MDDRNRRTYRITFVEGFVLDGKSFGKFAQGLRYPITSSISPARCKDVTEPFRMRAVVACDEATGRYFDMKRDRKMEERNFLTIRHEWARDETVAIYDSPFMDLISRAQTIHGTIFDPGKGAV
jgi:hypothetical protein